MAKAPTRNGTMMRALGLALVAALLGTLVLAASASALPGRFWGVMPQGSLTAEQFQQLKRGGVDSVRIPFDWGTAQPERGGAYNWSTTDAMMEKVAANRLDALAYISGAPAWAVPHVRVPGGGGTTTVARLPVHGFAAKAWRKLVRQAILRYGPRGSFWRQRPDLPKRPIRAWQIWNEPNFKYFVARPNAAQYGKLVKQSYAIAKRTDPKAQIVLAGMFALPKNCKKQRRPLSPCASDFLQTMYDRTPGLRRSYDGVALHPYSDRWQDLRWGISEIRQVLRENRDARKPLWLTELGWSSMPPEPRRNVFAKGVNGQRNQLKGAFGLLQRKQQQWRIKRVYWFSVEDLADSCNFCDGSGLFGEEFRPKKAWHAYVRFAGGRAN